MKRSGLQIKSRGIEILVIPQNWAGSHEMRSSFHLWREIAHRLDILHFVWSDRESFTHQCHPEERNESLCFLNLETHTHTHTLEWGHHGRIILTPTEWFSSHHGQDAVQDDVQLHCGGVCVVQDGPGQLVHTVVSRQVQVLHDVVVAAHFLRGHPICCVLKSPEISFRWLQTPAEFNLLDLFYPPEFNLWENPQFPSWTFIIPECAIYA